VSYRFAETLFAEIRVRVRVRVRVGETAFGESGLNVLDLLASAT